MLLTESSLWGSVVLLAVHSRMNVLCNSDPENGSSMDSCQARGKAEHSMGTTGVWSSEVPPKLQQQT